MSGWSMSDKTKQKISQSKKGKKQSAERNKKFVESTAKNWLITTPNGDKLVIKNLAKFCRENNLNTGNFSSRGRTKGFTAEKCGFVSS